MYKRNKSSTAIALIMGLAVLPLGVMADDSDDDDNKGFVLTGNCAQLPAGRTTEFHGNPATSSLNLAMAGNQWVVFDGFMQAFNEYRATSDDDDDDIDLTAIGNQPRTLAGERDHDNRCGHVHAI